MTEANRLFDAAARALVAGDHAAARNLFRRAGEAGRLDAEVIHANFVASGIGAPADWGRGFALLRALAPRNRRSARELEVIEAMALAPEGDPLLVPTGERLSSSPEITLFRGLFTPEECRYLAEAAWPMLQPSVVIDTATGRQVRDPVRTSDGVGFTWPLENPAVHALNRRIAAASGTAPGQAEPLQVLRYRPGDQYRTHYDAIPGFANQRVLTVIVWLNAGYEGGETHFAAANLKLRGAPGDALLFRNTGAGGRPDPASAHAGLPVTAGEKLLASRWIRERKFEG
jgi:prolyl 4-hydroxylase